MPPFTIEQLRAEVTEATDAYNMGASDGEKVTSIELFGSYAEGKATRDSDVDLLVGFASPVVSLFTLARVLDRMEQALGVSVDVVQKPLPADSLLSLRKAVPLYERA